jgi:hypothetical protein
VRDYIGPWDIGIAHGAAVLAVVLRFLDYEE